METNSPFKSPVNVVEDAGLLNQRKNMAIRNRQRKSTYEGLT
jgi:hypothetical protein